jgi:hypothetical protein
MAKTNTIPAGTYPPGTYPFGPVNVPAGTTRLEGAFDTTNYDSGPSPTLALQLQISTDSGASYGDPIPWTWTGPNAVRNGVAAHTTSIAFGLGGVAPGGNQWKVKGQAVVSGQSYVSAAAGTIDFA